MKKGLFILIIVLGLVYEAKAQGEHYFPEDNKNNKNLIGGDRNHLYSMELSAMKEPILYNDTSKNETYRFNWFRSFDDPIIIRIEKSKDTYLLYWKSCYNKVDKPMALLIDERKIIDKATWDLFKEKLKNSAYWKMDINEFAPPGVIRMEGSQWILEGKTATKYHVADRWSPDSKSKYYQCCDYLIGLTDLNIPPRGKY